MNKTEAYITASKFYLTEELPSDFFELDEQDVTDFIRDNRWEPFEEWEPRHLGSDRRSSLRISNHNQHREITYEQIQNRTIRRDL